MLLEATSVAFQDRSSWKYWTLGEDGIRPCYFYNPGGDEANIGVVVSATWGERLNTSVRIAHDPLDPHCAPAGLSSHLSEHIQTHTHKGGRERLVSVWYKWERYLNYKMWKHTWLEHWKSFDTCSDQMKGAVSDLWNGMHKIILIP